MRGRGREEGEEGKEEEEERRGRRLRRKRRKEQGLLGEETKMIDCRKE